MTDDELVSLTSVLGCSQGSVYKNLKKTLANNYWAQDDNMICALKDPLQRLCVQYLYVEKRRGYALNPVGELTKECMHTCIHTCMDSCVAYDRIISNTR